MILFTVGNMDWMPARRYPTACSNMQYDLLMKVCLIPNPFLIVLVKQNKFLSRVGYWNISLISQFWAYLGGFDQMWETLYDFDATVAFAYNRITSLSRILVYLVDRKYKFIAIQPMFSICFLNLNALFYFYRFVSHFEETFGYLSCLVIWPCPR